MIRLSLAFALGLLALGCPEVTPAPNTGLQCQTGEVACGRGLCCPAGYECPLAGQNACEFVGDDVYSVRKDGGR